MNIFILYLYIPLKMSQSSVRSGSCDPSPQVWTCNNDCGPYLCWGQPTTPYNGGEKVKYGTSQDNSITCHIKLIYYNGLSLLYLANCTEVKAVSNTKILRILVLLAAITFTLILFMSSTFWVIFQLIWSICDWWLLSRTWHWCHLLVLSLGEVSYCEGECDVDCSRTCMPSVRILGHCHSMSIYRKVSNIRCTKCQNLNDSRLVLQLSVPNPLKPSVKSIMKM